MLVMSKHLAGRVSERLRARAVPLVEAVKTEEDFSGKKQVAVSNLAPEAAKRAKRSAKIEDLGRFRMPEPDSDSGLRRKRPSERNRGKSVKIEESEGVNGMNNEQFGAGQRPKNVDLEIETEIAVSDNRRSGRACKKRLSQMEPEKKPKREPVAPLEHGAELSGPNYPTFQADPVPRPEGPREQATSLYAVPPTAKLSENFSFSRKQPNVFELVDIEDLAPQQPQNWHLIYNEVVRMRAHIFTPVDSMGCEKMANAINPGISQDEPRLFRFQILVSLMLSAQTKDEVNHRAILKLQKHLQQRGYPKLCMEGILECSEAEIDDCIGQVGFHRRKAVYLKKASEMLRVQYGGDIPKTIKEITALPGVGPKMGYLLLQIAWGINEGIGVDVHLHRLAVKWGWVPKTDKPEVTRLSLQQWLPRRYWADINPILVGFGQSVCTPQATNCDICTLSAGLCKGVDRRMAAQEMSPKRREKLLKSRGDVSGLIRMQEEARSA